MSELTKIEVEGQVVTQQPALNLGQFCFPTQSLATIQTGAAARATEVLGKLMVSNSATRNVERFRFHMLKQAELLAFAEEAISLKPVGKGIEAKSVFLAKYMATEWGHIKWTTEDAGGEHVSQVTARVWDFQKNMEAEATVTVRHTRKANGAIEKVTDPQDIQMLVKSETSKVVRNVIFSVLPPDIVKEVYEACLSTLDKYAAAELKDADNIIKFYVEKFGVPKAEIFNWLKVNGPQDLKAIHIRRMKALFNSIRDGEINPADVFKTAKDIPTKGQKEKKGKADPKSSSTTEEFAQDATKQDAEPTADQSSEAESSAHPAPTADSSKADQSQQSAPPESADTSTKETTSTTKETTSKSKNTQTEASDQSKPAKGKTEVTDAEKQAMQTLFV